jgi:hypothetical protein
MRLMGERSGVEWLHTTVLCERFVEMAGKQRPSTTANYLYLSHCPVIVVVIVLNSCAQSLDKLLYTTDYVLC